MVQILNSSSSIGIFYGAAKSQCWSHEQISSIKLSIRHPSIAHTFLKQSPTDIFLLFFIKKKLLLIQDERNKTFPQTHLRPQIASFKLLLWTTDNTPSAVHWTSLVLMGIQIESIVAWLSFHICFYIIFILLVKLSAVLTAIWSIGL